MRIQGVESLLRRGVHRLMLPDGKVLQLQITAVPIDVVLSIARELPEPQPPLRLVGMRGDRKIETEDNNPEHQAAKSAWIMERAAAFAYHGLRGEPGITWDAVSGNGQHFDAAFYRRVLAEVTALGMSSEELIRLAVAVRELGVVDEKQLEEASKDFLARGAGRTSG